MTPRRCPRRSLADSELLRSLNALLPILESQGIGVARAHPSSGRLLWVSRALCEITGYEESELVGMRIGDLAPAEDREALGILVPERASGRAQPPGLQCRYRRKDGRTIPVRIQSTVVPSRSGRSVTLLTFVEHMSEREGDHDPAKAYVQSTIDASPSHIAILDSQARIIYVNRAWCQYADANGFEWPDYGLGREYTSWRDGASPSGELAAVAEGIQAVVRGARPEFTYAYDCGGPQSEAWYQTIVTRFQTGSDDRVIALHHDITEVKRAERSLQQLAVSLMRAQDDERRRIALELHDVTAQNLFTASLNLSRLESMLAQIRVSQSTTRAVTELVRESSESVRQSLKEIRGLSYVLHPPLLDQTGLVTALEWFAGGFSKRTDIQVDLVVDRDFPRLRPDIEVALYRIVQECFANIQRHSQSKTASASLRIVGENVVLQVRDEGVGIPDGLLTRPARGEQVLGVGITGMRQRMLQLGAKLDIQSSSSGTTVTAVVPVPTQEEEEDGD